MTNPSNLVSRAAALALVASLSACGGKSDSALTDEEGLLGLIPADSPYVFAAVEPLPEDVLEKLEASTDAMLDAYIVVLEESLAQGEASNGGDDGDGDGDGSDSDSEDSEAARALVREFVSLGKSENLRAAGVKRGPRMAVYGYGLLPVFRIELANPVAFEAKLAEIEGKVGTSLEQGEIDGVPYKYLSDDDSGITVYVAVVDDYAVAAVGLASSPEDRLAALLGITRPGQSMADAGTFAELAERYDYTAHAIGLIDTVRVASMFLDPQSGANAELFETAGYDPSTIPAACRSELADMAAIAPRVVSGYTAVSVDAIESVSVAELRTDLAAGMSGLAAPVPGMGADHGGLGSVGVSLDLAAVREFLEARLDAYESDPYECDWFAGLSVAATQLRTALAQPAPPIVYSIRGVLGVIDTIDGMDMSGRQPPSDIRARLLVASDNAVGLYQMGALFSPELQGLSIEPDGVPVPIPAPAVAGPVRNAFFAMTDSSLALSVGHDDSDLLGALVESEPTEPAPMLSVRVDGERYRQFVADAMEAGENAASDAEARRLGAETREAMATAVTGMGESVDRVAVDVIPGDRGIELHSTVTLK